MQSTIQFISLQSTQTKGGSSSVAEWLACWTQALKGLGSNHSLDAVGQTVYTRRASVHQAAKLVAALLRVMRVTAGLAESNGCLLPGLWLMSPAGWLPRTGISSRTLRSPIKYGLPLPFYTNKSTLIYTVSQKSEPPKHFATASANLHRFKWNFTHTRWHLFLSSTSNSVYEMFNSFKLLLSQISVTDTTYFLQTSSVVTGVTSLHVDKQTTCYQKRIEF